MRNLTLLKTVLSSLIFWGWNSLFMMISLMLVVQLATVSLPWGFWFAFLSLAAMPAFSLAMGARKLKEPGWHFRWFYGVEGPLVFLSLLRVTMIRELTVPLAVWLAALAGMFLFYAVQIGKGLSRNGGLAVAQVVGAGAMLFLALGGVAMLGLVTIPVTGSVLEGIGDILKHFFSFEWLTHWNISDLAVIPMIGMSLGFFAATASLYLVMPYAALALYLGSWRRIFRDSWERFGAWPSTALTGVGVIGTGLLLWSVDQVQPHEVVLPLVREMPTTEAQRAFLLEHREQVHEGLVDAALSGYRYWGSTSDSNAVAELWRTEGFFRRRGGDWSAVSTEGDAADYAQAIFNNLASPLLYRGGAMREDQELARQRYEQIFDQPFDKAERQTIHDALDATWERDEAKAGIADIDQQRVHLDEQSLTWNLKGDIAQVQLEETYRNVTANVQEIQVSFSMPETAVLTGVWLSDDPQNRMMYGPILAPRGAAQAVYERLRQRGTDPALLEEVGPRQYRLRVFPIPGSGEVVSRGQEPRNKPVYLRMTWTTLLDAQGIPVPQMLEARNLYWDKDTQRQAEQTSFSPNEWLPARVGPVAKAEVHRTTLPDGTVVEARPLEGASPHPTGQHFAVLVDTSLSMESNREQLAQEWAWIQKDLAPGNQVDAFAASGWGGPGIQPLSAPPTLFFGQLRIQDAFNQLVTVAKGPYDATFYLTDDGSYDKVTDTSLEFSPGKLWLIHLGGKFPIGYPDAIGDRLIAGGGVATSMAEAVARLGTQQGDVVDGYLWKKLESTPPSPDNQDPFAPLAARRYLAWTARDQGQLSLEQLDQAHQFAKAYEMVSPWSSLLVLVNDWQKDLLQQEEAKDDRFEREGDDGSQWQSQPNSPLVSSVPEPETWMFLGITVLGLGWYSRREGRLPTLAR